MNIQSKKIIKKFDYVFALRPMLFFPGWSTLLAGFFIGQKQKLFFSPAQIGALDHGRILVLLLVFAAAMGASFLLNQLQDVDSDRQNKKLFIISEGHITKKAVQTEIAVLLPLSLILAFGQSLFMGWLVVVFILITGYLYNFRPFRFKDFPLTSLLANAAMGWLAFAIGWAANSAFAEQIFLDATPYLLFNTALYLYTTLPDKEGDMKTGKKTPAAVLGMSAFFYSAFILFVLSIVSALLLKDYLALFFLVLSAPFFISTLWNKSISAAVRTTKYAILFFALAVCLKWPFYFILMVSGFYLTKTYFRLRFNYDYPNFRGT